MPLLNFREHGYSAMYFKPWNKELLFKKKERISKQINQDLEEKKKQNKNLGASQLQD